MVSSTYLIIASCSVFFLTWIGTWAALPFLHRSGALDIPGIRSSHQHPTPTGGGIVPVLVISIAWICMVWIPGISFDVILILLIIVPALFLMFISWIDDIRKLSPVTRLLVHFFAVGFGVLSLPGPIFQGMFPIGIDIFICALLWVWFINLFNFMDGIDGIACVEVAVIGLGVALVSALSFIGIMPLILGATLASAAIGFLLWNWQPARIFLGDSGSVPLAFFIGWILLTIAAKGQWASAIILPMIFVGDATVTLLRRLWNREQIWAAHKTHFYQRAANGMGSHAKVTSIVGFVNLGLIALASMAALKPDLSIISILLSILVVAFLLLYFEWASRLHRKKHEK